MDLCSGIRRNTCSFRLPTFNAWQYKERFETVMQGGTESKSWNKTDSGYGACN